MSIWCRDSSDRVDIPRYCSLRCLRSYTTCNIACFLITVLPGGVVYTNYDPMEVAGMCVSVLSLNQVATFSENRVGSSGIEEPVIIQHVISDGDDHFTTHQCYDSLI